jgi:hypothetical protein
MKKRLEADLVSIAHRILQLKNKSDVNQLFLETQKLYEKLSVLRFVNEHYGTTKPTITHAEIEKEIEDLYDKSSDLPIATIIKMAGFVPIAVVPAEGTIVELGASKEISAEEVVVQEPAATAEPNEKESSIEDAELTAENVDDLGDFAADIAEQPLEDIEALEGEVSTIEIETEEIPQEFHSDAAEGKIADKEIHEEELATEDATDLGDFAADIAEQPLEDIETSEEETEEVPVPEFKSSFELTGKTEVETPKKSQTIQISFEDLLGGPYSEPDFVKVDEIEALPPETLFEAVEKIEDKKTPPAYAPSKITESKTVSLNDKFSKGIDIDLNDRIAFVKHLFGNSSEDYNRVLNQLITFDNFYETRNFIDEMVKPDYNNWEGKNDYAERFMDIIEKKFL